MMMMVMRAGQCDLDNKLSKTPSHETRDSQYSLQSTVTFSDEDHEEDDDDDGDGRGDHDDDNALQ